MKRPNPRVGDYITVHWENSTTDLAQVTDLLATQFTATVLDSTRVLFLYYDRLKGDAWGYTNERLATP